MATLKVPVRGDARIALLDASRGAELLVMGSRGRGIFRSLLGSVSAAVAKHAACPVAVVRGRDADAEIRRVVVGADGSDGSRAVVAHAYRLGSLYRVPVLVVHCYWDVVAAAAGARELPREDPENQRLEVGLAELVAGLAEDHPDVDVRIALRHGLVDTVLTSHSLPGDLIVVGRHEVSSPAHLLTGSVATAVLEQARSTVVVVPELRPTRRPAAPAP